VRPRRRRIPLRPCLFVRSKTGRGVARSALPRTAVAIVWRRSAFGISRAIPGHPLAIREPHQGDCAQRRVSVNSFRSKFMDRRAPDFREIRRRPYEAMQPVNIKTMSDRLVAATYRRSLSISAFSCGCLQSALLDSSVRAGLLPGVASDAPSVIRGCSPTDSAFCNPKFAFLV